jgi:hypothetical protein
MCRTGARIVHSRCALRTCVARGLLKKFKPTDIRFNVCSECLGVVLNIKSLGGQESLEAVSKLLRLPFCASAVLEILTYFYIRCGFSAPATRKLTALA